jgi:hypothetical protein
MNFLDTVQRAKSYLQEEGRVSLRALKLGFQLDANQLEALVEELVDIQQIAAREGKALAWMGPATGPAAEVVDTQPPTLNKEPEPLNREPEAEHLSVLIIPPQELGPTAESINPLIMLLAATRSDDEGHRLGVSR